MIPNCTSGPFPRERVAPILRAFFGIAREWTLSPEQQMKLLGLDCPQSFARWQAGETVDVRIQHIDRVAEIFRIANALDPLIPGAGRSASWLRAPNAAPLFGGGCALDMMTTGDLQDLISVREYIEAELYR